MSFRIPELGSRVRVEDRLDVVREGVVVDLLSSQFSLHMDNGVTSIHSYKHDWQYIAEEYDE